MSKFTVNKDDKEIELEFAEPSAADLTEASKIYNKTFATMLDAGGLLRRKLADKLTEQGLWDDNRQQRLEVLQKTIVEKQHKLHKGGIKLAKARELALSIKKDRDEQGQLLASYNEYDNMTVEGQADNARFNYLVYACTVYSNNKGRKYFKTYEDFASYSDPVAFTAAQKYASAYYGLDEGFETTLPENKFLQQYRFVDENLRLINEDGHLIDEEGNLIDETGARVDKDGNIVDIFGFKRTDTGEFADKSKPFLDDDGKPVAVDSEVETELETVASEDSA